MLAQSSLTVLSTFTFMLITRKVIPSSPALSSELKLHVSNSTLISMYRCLIERPTLQTSNRLQLLVNAQTALPSLLSFTVLDTFYSTGYWSCIVLILLIILIFWIFIYLAALSLSCSTQDLRSSLQPMGPLVVACKLLLVLQHVVSSSLTRNRTQTPFTGSHWNTRKSLLILFTLVDYTFLLHWKTSTTSPRIDCLHLPVCL